MATVGRRVARVKATRAMDLEEAANIVRVCDGGRYEGKGGLMNEREKKKEKKRKRRKKKR